jgi:hypothetical protein
MGLVELHPDFKDFLRLLNSHRVKYLLVGGYAVGYHGYPRATGDLDIWVSIDENNAEKTADVLREFGMAQSEVSKDLFMTKDKVIRMGVPPVRIEVITSASGVTFDQCYANRDVVEIEDLSVNFISLNDLKTNKKACNRHKDLEDLVNLP